MHPSSVPASAERALMSAFESLPRLQRGRDRGSGSRRGKVEVVVAEEVETEVVVAEEVETEVVVAVEGR